MKILVVVLILVFGLIAILLLIGLFLKKEYVVTREVLINKPKAFVFDFIKLLKNQNRYSKWATMDPNMKVVFTGIDGTPGFVSAWDSDDKNVGKGAQEITKVIEGERIDYEIRFITPFESTSYASMSVASINENQTKVIWEFNGKMKYPMNLMLLFMNMEKMIGDDLDTGLQNLKGIL